ncbi:Hemolysin [Granulibacter bethesdensis]|uniref:hypothetical protein n=1 Tax=Granulibacter bethesdensis TaxID=364410 RepID=UPI00090CA025|nr:hypothetical protein [Granulibacter bethesdensis]APH57498.1 Hemolysin [Granulibacter bethesdensis]
MTISGHPTGTFGAQALVSVFGMSPGAAELLYGMAGGAAASAAGSARQIPGTVIVKDGEMTVVGQPGVQVKGYGTTPKENNVSLSNVPDSNEYVDILSPDTRQHILYGDDFSRGGHYPPGNPGKTLFPESMTPD